MTAPRKQAGWSKVRNSLRIWEDQGEEQVFFLKIQCSIINACNITYCVTVILIRDFVTLRLLFYCGITGYCQNKENILYILYRLQLSRWYRNTFLFFPFFSSSRESHGSLDLLHVKPSICSLYFLLLTPFLDPNKDGNGK